MQPGGINLLNICDIAPECILSINWWMCKFSLLLVQVDILNAVMIESSKVFIWYQI